MQLVQEEEIRSRDKIRRPRKKCRSTTSNLIVMIEYFVFRVLFIYSKVSEVMKLQLKTNEKI